MCQSVPCEAKEDSITFYRKRISTKKLGVEEILRLVRIRHTLYAHYQAQKLIIWTHSRPRITHYRHQRNSYGHIQHLFRNCQIEMKNLAEKITDKTDMYLSFTWPWHSFHISKIILATFAAAGAAPYLAPVTLTQPEVHLLFKGSEFTRQWVIDWSMGWNCITGYWGNIVHITKSV